MHLVFGRLINVLRYNSNSMSINGWGAGPSGRRAWVQIPKSQKFCENFIGLGKNDLNREVHKCIITELLKKKKVSYLCTAKRRLFEDKIKIYGVAKKRFFGVFFGRTVAEG